MKHATIFWTGIRKGGGDNLGKAACRPQLVIGKELTDKQLKANIEEMMSVRKQSLKIDKKYYKKFAKTLNAKQQDAIFRVKAQMEKCHKVPGKEMKALPYRHTPILQEYLAGH